MLQKLKSIAAASIILAAGAGFAVSAHAGGWGQGLSLKTTKKIVNQAAKDVSNGATAISKPPVPALVGDAAVAGVCVATAGACAVAFSSKHSARG